VFSQFTSTLKWLQEELPKHGFQYRTLSGDMPMKKRAKALSDFQNDPPTTIFLLSMRAGAVGINLTQANRVFLMEPCFNPALEAQAVGRVHRLGQKRDVEIIRLIMQDSVESRMLEILKKKYGGSGDTSDSPEGGANDSAVGEDDDEDDGDKKPAAIVTAPVLVGSICTDKATVVAEEFDLLYGVPEIAVAQEEVDVADLAAAESGVGGDGGTSSDWI
jgi:superfamily II DNA/RNA helicase